VVCGYESRFKVSGMGWDEPSRRAGVGVKSPVPVQSSDENKSSQLTMRF